MELMLEELGRLTMTDAVCDEDLASFYEAFGMQRMQRVVGMVIRNG